MQAVETFRRNVSTRALGPALLIAMGLMMLAATAACGGGPKSTPSTSHAESGSPVAVLPTTTITFTNASRQTVQLTVEIADSADERQRGLMFRESLAEDAGMLFVFERETEAGFWMRFTPVPLSIAFISAGGIILHIEDMEPLTEKLHYSPRPFRYAVEANQGWFETKGIGVGDTLQLPLPHAN